MLHKLIKIANSLDRKGMYKEAADIDEVAKELSEKPELRSGTYEIVDKWGGFLQSNGVELIGNAPNDWTVLTPKFKERADPQYSLKFNSLGDALREFYKYVSNDIAANPNFDTSLVV